MVNHFGAIKTACCCETITIRHQTRDGGSREEWSFIRMKRASAVQTLPIDGSSVQCDFLVATQAYFSVKWPVEDRIEDLKRTVLRATSRHRWDAPSD
jgi:hypothetical protein